MTIIASDGTKVTVKKIGTEAVHTCGVNTANSAFDFEGESHFDG